MARVRLAVPRLAVRRGAARPLLAAAALACLGAPAGCGGGTQRPDPPVRLRITSPVDATVLRGREVEVRGRVGPPQSQVLVAGREVAVDGGGFSATVPLRDGVNVIDVLASSDGRSPAMTAVRVTREATIRVPDVTGLDPAEARSRLAAAGLGARILDEGDLLDALLVPLSRRVCDTSPAPGASVRRGATVLVKVAKVC